MQIAHSTDKICNERELFEELLALDGKSILELGCGKAELTRQIASTGQGRTITATDVDEIQHSKNLLITDLPNVTFIKAGSEAIPLGNESIDVVFMFKSLHHVPLELMGTALKEVRRILKPGGLAYISEPLLSGDFNEVLRLFHDEEKVRDSAFKAVEKSVTNDEFVLVDELFFNTPMCFENFDDFENKVIKVTHNNHQLSAGLLQQVQDAFSRHMKDDGARFLLPLRVDLLQKKA